jgi:hypothetical protein
VLAGLPYQNQHVLERRRGATPYDGLMLRRRVGRVCRKSRGSHAARGGYGTAVLRFFVPALGTLAGQLTGSASYCSARVSLWASRRRSLSGQLRRVWTWIRCGP